MSDSLRPYPGMSALSISRSVLCLLALPLALPVSVYAAPHHAAPAHTAAPHHAATSPRAKAHQALAPAHAASHTATRAHSRPAEAAEAAGNRPRGRAPAVSSTRAHAKGHAAPPQLASREPALRSHSSRKPVVSSAPQLTEAAAERIERAENTAAETRVHAWYRAQHQPPAALSQPRLQPAAPDLSVTPRKATSDDFARAAAAQRSTIRSAAEVTGRQTTAADDAADAAAETPSPSASHIPSTAPTEREPSPFLHGDPPILPVDHTAVRPPAAAPPQRAAVASNTASAVPHPALPQPATSRPLPTPGGTAPPRTDSTVLATTPAALAGAGSPRAVRQAVAAVTAEPTPRLRLPAPAVPGRSPAVAAIAHDDAHPALDPVVSNGMAAETFDDDVQPATPAVAVRLAATGSLPGALAPATATPTTLAAALPVPGVIAATPLLLVAPMRGTHEILVHQNRMAVADGLERIENDRELATMRRAGLLVALPDDDTVYPNDALPLNRRFARPWTVRFLRDLARAHAARFGTPLIVTSAARTVEFQRRLVRVNGNAAPPTGDIASPHLYGQAVDIGKGRMSLTEINWLRAWLTPVENDGKIDVEEEFQQACFHISVYRRYLGAPTPVRPAQPPALLQANAPAAPASRRHLPTALLATHLP